MKACDIDKYIDGYMEYMVLTGIVMVSVFGTVF